MPATPGVSITKDYSNKKITIVKTFVAPLAQVWEAWSSSVLLDAWWSPEPLKTITRTMNFSEGGYWLYCIIDPAGQTKWARIDYISIQPLVSISALDAFCDDQGNKSSKDIKWTILFKETLSGVAVTIEMTFDASVDLNEMLKHEAVGLSKSLTKLQILMQAKPAHPGKN